ncbi:MAG TPA: alkaline phosphatase, partial [Hyphomonadaceae bacterium]|nr:alkaline phosphatase [Hyphomonadaceae bacterium]
MTTTSRRDLLKLGAISFGAAAAACTQAKPLLPYEGSVTFAHGVASGDPGLDRVVVWTR